MMDQRTPYAEVSASRDVPHESAMLHVTGRADYTDDLPIPEGALHAALGLATVAHGTIRRMDLDAVRAAPGVVGVLTAAYIPGRNDVSPIGRGDDPILAEGRVMFHGQPVFAVIAETREAARRAATLAEIDYDDAPFVLDPVQALAAGGDMAAIILEPLILGSGGMRMYGPQVLEGIRRICDRHGVLMIADEVMTGWGRTGEMWACDHAGIAPDILCTSKGLTGGAIPLAATLATEEIFQAHWSEDRSRTFFHSSSYTANPLACAAGLANARIWAAGGMQARLKAVAAMQSERLAALARDDRFADARQTSTIAAIDLKVEAAGYLAAVGQRLRAHALERGVLLRPLGNTVYVMPPYCMTGDQMDRVWEAISGFPA